MFIVIRQVSCIFTAVILLTACGERTPPDTRATVTLPVYSEGDKVRGAIIYEEACAQCHQLTPGLNKKGPQLMNIYGAKAAQLADYEYSEGLKASGWVWDADTLDPYIEDVEKAMPESKMLADPMPDASERADVIAYLSTLRSSTTESTTVEDSKSHSKMTNDAIDISTDEADKPAADFQ